MNGRDLFIQHRNAYFKFQDVEADGNCMYYCLAKCPATPLSSVDDIRRVLAKMMRKPSEHLLNFFVEYHKSDGNPSPSLEKWQRTVLTNTEWGSNFESSLFGAIYGVDVRIITNSPSGLEECDTRTLLEMYEVDSEKMIPKDAPTFYLYLHKHGHPHQPTKKPNHFAVLNPVDYQPPDGSVVYPAKGGSSSNGSTSPVTVATPSTTPPHSSPESFKSSIFMDTNTNSNNSNYDGNMSINIMPSRPDAKLDGHHNNNSHNSDSKLDTISRSTKTTRRRPRRSSDQHSASTGQRRNSLEMSALSNVLSEISAYDRSTNKAGTIPNKRRSSSSMQDRKNWGSVMSEMELYQSESLLDLMRTANSQQQSSKQQQSNTTNRQQVMMTRRQQQRQEPTMERRSLNKQIEMPFEKRNLNQQIQNVRKRNNGKRRPSDNGQQHDESIMATTRRAGGVSSQDGGAFEPTRETRRSVSSQDSGAFEPTREARRSISNQDGGAFEPTREARRMSSQDGAFEPTRETRRNVSSQDGAFEPTRETRGSTNGTMEPTRESRRSSNHDGTVDPTTRRNGNHDGVIDSARETRRNHRSNPSDGGHDSRNSMSFDNMPAKPTKPSYHRSVSDNTERSERTAASSSSAQRGSSRRKASDHHRGPDSGPPTDINGPAPSKGDSSNSKGAKPRSSRHSTATSSREEESISSRGSKQSSHRSGMPKHRDEDNAPQRPPPASSGMVGRKLREEDYVGTKSSKIIGRRFTDDEHSKVTKMRAELDIQQHARSSKMRRRDDDALFSPADLMSSKQSLKPSEGRDIRPTRQRTTARARASRSPRRSSISQSQQDPTMNPAMELSRRDSIEKHGQTRRMSSMSGTGPSSKGPRRSKSPRQSSLPAQQDPRRRQRNSQEDYYAENGNHHHYHHHHNDEMLGKIESMRSHRSTDAPASTKVRSHPEDRQRRSTRRPADANGRSDGRMARESDGRMAREPEMSDSSFSRSDNPALRGTAAWAANIEGTRGEESVPRGHGRKEPSPDRQHNRRPRATSHQPVARHFEVYDSLE